MLHSSRRRQVLEYIPFTNRIALAEEFVPSDAEQKLYNLVLISRLCRNRLWNCAARRN